MDKQNVGRLAMREEGAWWVAYYALPNTMDDAIEMGRIAMVLVRGSDRREQFLEIMKSAIADFLETKAGERPEFWDEQPAPEHERSGKA